MGARSPLPRRGQRLADEIGAPGLSIKCTRVSACTGASSTHSAMLQPAFEWVVVTDGSAAFQAANGADHAGLTSMRSASDVLPAAAGPTSARVRMAAMLGEAGLDMGILRSEGPLPEAIGCRAGGPSSTRRGRLAATGAGGQASPSLCLSAARKRRENNGCAPGGMAPTGGRAWWVCLRPCSSDRVTGTPPRRSCAACGCAAGRAAAGAAARARACRCAGAGRRARGRSGWPCRAA